MIYNYKSYLSIIFFFVLTHMQAQQCSLLEVGDDVTATCTNNCVTLEAHFMPGFSLPSDPNYYSINASSPCPLPPVTGGTPTSITIDDEWSELVTLPFTFTFFGNDYTELIIGDNGVISFDINRTSPKLQKPGEHCEWNMENMGPLPSPNFFRNTIYGAYHDLYIPAGGTIEYYISGEAPQRIFVINYTDMAHFSCNSLRTTQRILLYESTNVIDVQITRKDLCSNWNDGLAAVGIQNIDGTVAYSPPGRNTGAWRVTEEELWRFSPNLPADPTYPHETKWFDNSDNTLVGTEDNINICVTEDKSFRVEVTFTSPDGNTYLLTDSINVYFDDSHEEVDLGPDMEVCANTTFVLDGTVEGAAAYQWQLNGEDIPGETNPTLIPSQEGTYTLIADIGICNSSDSITVTYKDVPQINLEADFHECEGTLRTLAPEITNLMGGETFQWQKDGVDIPGATGITLDISESGTYTLNITTTTGCVASKSVEVIYDEYPDLDLGEDLVVCPNETARILSNIRDAETYLWEVNGQTIPFSSETLVLDTPGDYDAKLTITRGVCTVTDSLHVKILEPLRITPTPVMYGELAVEAEGGLPPYYYSLNGIDFIQGGYFTGLSNGDYPIYVLDSNGCQYEFDPVHVIGLDSPKFITPNADGFNDIWRIGNAENTPDAILTIYDRYGKIIKRMNTDTSEFWDGTYNGKPLPASDYWYVLTLPNGKVYKGHFALKR